MLRRLALLEMPVFSGWLSAALLDQPLAPAEDVLDELVNAQLAETTGTGTGVYSQYRFHELVRVFARERLAAEEPAAEQTAAVERALGALLYLAEQAHIRYYGGDYFRMQSDALRWPLPGRLAEELVSDPRPGMTANAPRWSPGYGRQRRQGRSSCAGAWRTARKHSLSPGPTSTTGGRALTSPWRPPGRRSMCAVRPRCCTAEGGSVPRRCSWTRLAGTSVLQLSCSKTLVTIRAWPW